MAVQNARWRSSRIAPSGRARACLAVPVRWVLIRDPQEEFKTQEALLCTDLDADPERIISWFVKRWQLEMNQPHCPHKPQDVRLHAA